MIERITEIYWASEGRYGSPRVYIALKKQGLAVSRRRVERIMREQGLRGRVVQVTQRNSGLKKEQAKGKNLLLDMQKPSAINQVWVADITYLKLNGQWQYLSTIMDQYSRRLLGWSLSSTRTTDLTIRTLSYALKKRNYPKGVVFHTDRGIEYRGSAFQKLLKSYDFKHSMNRPGQCTDNAFMESFYHSLKIELIRGSAYKKLKDLRKALSQYINNFYNSVRLHSGINYYTPIEYEALLG